MNDTELNKFISKNKEEKKNYLLVEAKEIPELNKYCEKCLYLDTGKQFI